jgi:Na+/melibiose symporter-like transporter
MNDPQKGASPLLPGAPSIELRHYLWLVGAGFFLLTLVNPKFGLGLLPLQFLLKDQLHLVPLEVASFFALAGLPWYLKPLAGMLSDLVPFGRSRRRAYLTGSALLLALAWLGLAVGPRAFNYLLGALLLLNAAFVIFQATLSATLVEGGQELAASGRLSSSRSTMEYVAVLCVGPASGWLAARSFGLTGSVCALLAFGLVLLGLALRERAPQAGITAKARTRESISNVFRSKSMWSATAFFALLSFSPGFQTPLFYYKTNTLTFSSGFLGNLMLIGAASGALGAMTYGLACRRFPLRLLLFAGVGLDALAESFYVFYESENSAIIIEAIGGVVRGFAWLPILDLLVRAIPRGSEGMGAALEFSAANVSLAASDLLGSYLYETLGFSFSNLVWLNVGTTLLILLCIPWLPAGIMGRREGASVIPDPL